MATALRSLHRKAYVDQDGGEHYWITVDLPTILESLET